VITILRSVVIFLALSVLAKLIAQVGGLGWADSFTNERTFTVYFGWVDLSMLITWAFPAIVFASLGALLVVLRVEPQPIIWAVALGVAYSLDSFMRTTNHFAPSAPGYLYFWVYGIFLVPPLSAWLGALCVRAIARRFAQHAAA
jgi:hypothetical protein